MSLSLFIHDASDLIETYDTLELKVDGDRAIVKGGLAVVDGDGKLWHTYQVEICYVENYPFTFPVVYETGGEIPQIPDWHININGSCCLDNEFSQQIKCCKGISLLEFTQKELLPWFANQSYRRVTGNYVNGEQAHGDMGRIEFFMLELKAPNLLSCVEWMLKLAVRELPPRQAVCFCGSGEKWRKCHKPIFEKMYPISTSALYWAIDRFVKFLKAGRPVLEEIQKQTAVTIF